MPVNIAGKKTKLPGLFRRNDFFRRNAFNPTKVVYEWLDKEEVLICKDSTVFIESRSYYELSDEVPNNSIEIQGNLLNIQFANNYASIDDIKYSIYNAAKYAVVKPQSEKSSRSNSTEKENKHFNSNGLNRITINLQDYTLQPKTTNLLIVSDSKHNFYLNFKVTNQNEK